MTKMADADYRRIVRRYSVSFMNNTKSTRLFTALDRAGVRILHADERRAGATAVRKTGVRIARGNVSGGPNHSSETSSSRYPVPGRLE